MSYLSQNLNPWASGLVKALISAVVFIVPLWLAQNQTVGDLTVSSIVMWAIHWLDAKAAA